MNIRQQFLRYNAQTSPAPIALHIERAMGNYLYDVAGKAYLDLIGGISVCNVGHGHEAVLKAIKEQSEKYLHIMVYGELVQSPQVVYAQQLTAMLPDNLNCVYFTNSGAEAVEGAMKLAKRITGRPNIIACNKSYHGSTQGALSIIGDEYWRNAYRPLLPGIEHYDYNSKELITAVNNQAACVIIESIQAEAGVIAPQKEWLETLRARCNATGTLLIFDEIQCGFGRTGAFWGFEHYGVIPDVVLLGKALGGGLPLGAFISSYENMQVFTDNPVLGHISTFGGHPLSCAAGKAAMDALLSEKLIDAVTEKAVYFVEQLGNHPAIKDVRYKGLLMAIELENNAKVLEVLAGLLEKGFFSDWFLFSGNCIRIAPPLTISREELQRAAEAILNCL